MIQHLISLFNTDLERLQKEVESYSEEDVLWRTNGDISNSAGNLCLHLVGNLNHFIGAILGNTGYVRDRDSEFSLKNIARPELIASIVEVRNMVQKALLDLDPDDLEKNYPVNVFGTEMTSGYFLIRLVAHLNYHLGQINYHRRMLDL